MKGIGEIRGRIKSVKNTAQITRAMQLVAASKMKRAQKAAADGRPYTLLMAEIIASLPGKVEEASHPLMEPREVKRRGVILVSTDKGLCGGLNANLFREIVVAEEASGLSGNDVAYVAIGKKGSQFLARTGRNLVAKFQVSDTPLFTEVRAAADFMIEAFIDGKIDSIEILFPRFVNALTQEPTLVHLVPIIDLQKEIDEVRKQYGEENYHPAEDDREINFEPDAAAILAELPAMYVRHQIYHRVLELKASEQSSRMVAMKSATDNANSLVDDLTLEYNKARQAGITQEILELAAGAR